MQHYALWQAISSPVQRHRLPSKPFCRISGVGSTPLSLHDSRAAWQATTNPGVQNPHCRKCTEGDAEAKKPGDNQCCVCWQDYICRC